ncbi:unnamed protein product [Spirodela intermedia]|uniref:Homeobox domain-containing protein n=1 Tax=Spirodela intermedia TaxID=51605 RepID=A0A7I8JCI0_SPIIN|nr:unnamed protein product [Spirodela intermedia]CAA6667102.1 unnamed protein product [Spirodela intermedia]
MAGHRTGRPRIPVMEMEACLQETNNSLPDREVISSLAERFSASAERAGKVIIQAKQVWNWFQNRRYAQRAKMVKVPGKLNVSPSWDDSFQFRNVAPPITSAPPRSSSDRNQMEFEAKSSRDGAWYDVAQFTSHRMIETGDPEVRVRFTGFGIEEDEWINVRKCVRQRSLPCESSECVVLLPGDLILCFQEGREQALYFDAHVLDAQRRRHDARGCRCRFLVRYDHDQSEEIVPLRKVCRRPETDYRLRILRSTKAQAAMDSGTTAKHPVPPPQRPQNQERPMGVAAEEEAVNSHPPSPTSEPAQMETSPPIAGESNDGALVPDAMDGASAAAGGEVPSGRGTA